MSGGKFAITICGHIGRCVFYDRLQYKKTSMHLICEHDILQIGINFKAANVQIQKCQFEEYHAQTNFVGLKI